VSDERVCLICGDRLAAPPWITTRTGRYCVPCAGVAADDMWAEQAAAKLLAQMEEGE
jgi:hypothetical protein